MCQILSQKRRSCLCRINSDNLQNYYYLFKTLEAPNHKERSPKAIKALPFPSLSSKWVNLQKKSQT